MSNRTEWSTDENGEGWFQATKGVYAAKPDATLTVTRYTAEPDTFLISLAGFHYEGEGQLVTRDQLRGLVGVNATGVLIDQLDAACTQAEEAA